VRAGSKVTHEQHESLDAAIAQLAAHVASLTPAAEREEIRFLARRIEPARQVVARLELAGPGGARGGVDVRGDGSAEAFTGRVRRAIVERRRGESPADALARALAT
jgi:hypothetical protein